MVVAAAAPAVIGASQIGAGAAGAGAGASGALSSAALLSMLSQGLGGMGSLFGNKGENPKERKRQTLADLYQKLLQQQQFENIARREQENLAARNQANALQEMASGFRASLTGR